MLLENADDKRYLKGVPGTELVCGALDGNELVGDELAGEAETANGNSAGSSESLTCPRRV
jgi:hypothetical protein